jgi:hypothetical protein
VIYGDDRLPERFWEKVYPEPNTGCWLWGGALLDNGYGRWSVRISPTKTKAYSAHRAVALALWGPISSDMHVDHLCEVRACCNPAHLEIVTPQENLARRRGFKDGSTAKKISEIRRGWPTCPKGHEYTETTTRVDGAGRHCRVCEKAKRLRYQERVGEEQKERLRAQKRQYYAFSTYRNNIKEDN